jgi:DNA mismatch repair protein MutL
MSDIIHLLPDTVANQIAAGEVIQRPASVIKELVENAVDAGATVINVIIVDAGRTSIQVIDNGRGMSETDARLAFERHATSKIRQADDLFALHTMGFRGEALPSIAAVSQVELITRTADEEIGTHLTISASKVLSQEPASCPVGSNFKVENIFYNVPARRKFLKSNATELNNILVALERIVLVYPDICFTLHHNGTELINVRQGSLRQRICDIFGHRFSQDILPVEVETTMCRLTGFVGKPEAARRRGAQQYFFVNGRFMKHPYFHKAVLNAYERLIPEGTQVPYFLYFDVAPADIDVNIHPTKTEIKFENEQTIWQILSAAVKEAIGKFCEVPSIDFDTEGRPDIPVFNPTDDSPRAPQVSFNPTYNPFNSDNSRSASGSQRGSHVTNSTRRSQQDWAALYEAAFAPAAVPEESSLFEDAGSPSALLQEKSPAHYQYKGCYIMTAVKSGLMIIDQYRASVRIMYERYQSQMAEHTAVPQRILFPEAVQFSPSEAALLQQLIPELTTMGFELSDLGGGSYAVNAVPSGVDGDPIALVRHLVDDAAEHGGIIRQNYADAIALTMARHTAVPHGQVLSNEEMETIVNQLFSCSDVNHSPDGRTILCILPQHDIEHLLG